MIRMPLLLVPLILSGCGRADYDPRGMKHEETLLSVSATGRADTRPDRAEFQAGINSWSKTSQGASAANQQMIEKIVASLNQIGIVDKDIQTRSLSIQRLDWGDRKGQYQASNVVNVTVRNVDRAAAAVGAVTGVGANILSGPDLRMSDPEKAANSAYAAAYKAARSRAQAYADAAGMTVSRILSIRDAGGMQGGRALPGAVPVAPPPVAIAVEQSAANDAGARLMPGQTASEVAVQVDFALTPKSNR
ncbi:MAG TPA: SIMPL domain-containing protein [Sphingobium sp.]|nr:SIMPL domain-containing protein [Sphingobium sp.]